MFLRLKQSLLFLLVASAAWLPQADAMVRPLHPSGGDLAAVSAPIFQAAEQETWVLVYVYDSENPYNGDFYIVQSPLGLWILQKENDPSGGFRYIAVPEKGDTLSGLAKTLIGKASAYGQFGFQGNPSRLAVGKSRVDVTQWIAPRVQTISAYVDLATRSARVRRSLGQGGQGSPDYATLTILASELGLDVTDTTVGSLELWTTATVRGPDIQYIGLKPIGPGVEITGGAPKVLTVLKWTGRVTGVAGVGLSTIEAASSFGEGDILGGVRNTTFGGCGIVALTVSGPIGWTAGLGAGVTAIGLGVCDIRNEARLQEQLGALKWQHEQWLHVHGPITLRKLQTEQEQIRSGYLDAVELLNQFTLEGAR